MDLLAYLILLYCCVGAYKGVIASIHGLPILNRDCDGSPDFEDKTWFFATVMFLDIFLWPLHERGG